MGSWVQRDCYGEPLNKKEKEWETTVESMYWKLGHSFFCYINSIHASVQILIYDSIYTLLPVL